MSGPASGVIASARLAEECGLRNVIAFDMGGTSSDFAVLVDYKIPYSSETRIGNLPVVFPSVDVVSVGAGGGSIARLDNLGVLKVGPESAGADPGPVCYGRGGTAATVTDAYLVTGVVDENNFLGGAVPLHASMAKQAIDAIAERTKYSTDELAEGVLRVATSNMILGIGQIEGRIGFDIRDFTLLAYGGAGPTQACMLAEYVGIRKIAVPLSPGTFCALGSLSADFRIDYVQTVNTPLGEPDWKLISRWYAEKEAAAARLLEQEGSLIEAVVAVRSADVRYEGQGFNTEVAIAPDVLSNTDTKKFADAFFAKYEQLYGVAQSSVPGEVANIRLTVIGQRARDNSTWGLPTTGEGVRPHTNRSVYFDGARQTIPVFRRSDLGAGARVRGPCVVDQSDTTTFIRPNWHGLVDIQGVLHLERE
jgi:N-methylhydantoinase A